MIEQTPLPQVFRITPPRFGDHRGFFSESWNKSKLEAAGLTLPEFVQDNHSLSREVGTVRGLHFQSPPHAQGKLVRCGRGVIFDVAVDVRKGSRGVRYLRPLGDLQILKDDRKHAMVGVTRKR